MNYIGDHPLNLIGKVAIITSASTPTGATICRTLLNSNAFVLGVDNAPAHESTKCARGSHFQFFRFEGERPLWSEVLGYARSMFWKDEVDVFVMVVEDSRANGVGGKDGSRGGVPNEVLEVMERRGEGLVIFVAGSEMVRAEEVIRQKQELHGRLRGKGVRCNAVLPSSEGILAGSDYSPPNLELLKHIDVYTSKRKEGGYAIEHGREMASLVLFLGTNQGSNIDGAIVASDGTCTPL